MLHKSIYSSCLTWNFLFTLSFLFASLHLSAQSAVMPNVKTISVIDTIYTFNPNTGKESVSFMTYEEEVVEVIDTIFTFDPNTYEESVKIVKSEIPLEEYQNSLKRQFKIEPIQEQEPLALGEAEIDTIITFNPDTFEETIKIITHPKPCYTLFWDDYPLKSGNISITQLNKLLNKEWKVVKSGGAQCEEAATFSVEIIVVPKGKDPVVQTYVKNRNKLMGSFVRGAYMVAGSDIYFDKITINGKLHESIRLSVK